MRVHHRRIQPRSRASMTSGTLRRERLVEIRMAVDALVTMTWYWRATT